MATPPANLETQVLSAQRMHPSSPAAACTTTPLSIVDSTTVTFGAASALWVFEPSPHTADHPPRQLLAALADALALYPHFAGQLDLNPWPAAGHDRVPHGQRFRRAVVRYGTAQDPGVAVETAHLAVPAAALFPDATARAEPNACWTVTADLAARFGPAGALAGGLASAPPGTPSVRIRLTRCACTSLVVGVAIAHPLADAITLIGFMQVWAAAHRAVLLGSNTSPSVPTCTATPGPPLFDPARLDACAAGDCDAATPDAALLQAARALPLPRYDWWAPPAPAGDPLVARVPAEIPATLIAPPGRQLPWSEWDHAAPVAHCVLRMTGAEVEALHARAVAAAPAVSRHDVLVAFIWQLVARAKAPTVAAGDDKDTDGGTIWLDTTMGLRPRLGLPPQFVGSPVLLAGLAQQFTSVTGASPATATAAGRRAVAADAALARTAAALRAHLARFDRPALAAWLHEQAHEPAPQRWWNGFLGSRHTMATSWVRAGVWEVDFGLGDGSGSGSGSGNGSQATAGPSEQAAVPVAGLRWAGVFGPRLDGLVVVAEAERGHERAWWRGGVDIDIRLEASAMARLHALLAEWRAESRASAETAAATAAAAATATAGNSGASQGSGRADD